MAIPLFSRLADSSAFRFALLGICLPAYYSLGAVSAQPGQEPKLADYLELDTAAKGLEVKNFDFPDRDIKDVVLMISKWTGKNFILDKDVTGKITILGPSQITLQEAYQAFLSALAAIDLTTVQNGKFIRIIRSIEARRSPVKTYSGEFAPSDDQFITRIFQLKYINAFEVQKDFRELVSKDGRMFAYEPTNSVIITDMGSNTQRIKELLEILDVKNFETTLHIIRLRNGSAKGVSDILGEIYGGRKSDLQKNVVERTRGGGVISRILPDEQTNSLIVLCNQAGFEAMKQLVEKLDVSVKDSDRIHVYYCEHTKAEDLAATLSAITQKGVRPEKEKEQKSATPAETQGGTKVTSDGATNSLVVIANTTEWQTLVRVLKKLDIARLQVFVESAILEVAVEDTGKVGFSFGVGSPDRPFNGGVNTDDGSLVNFLMGKSALGATIPIFAGPSFPINVPVPGFPGQMTKIAVNSFMGLLSLATTNTNTAILSTPQILALDNEKAEFQVVDEIPVQTTFSAIPAGVGTGLGNTPTGTIDTKKVGIVVKLTPHVNARSRTIRLEIEQKVDNIKNSVGALPSALENVSVATTSRVTNTTVTVRDQEYIMLGGLMSDKTTETTKKVPLLGDIPVLGWLFKSKTSYTQKTNLIVLMHPKIIDNNFVSSNLIKEQLKKRDEMLEKANAGTDPFKETVDDIRSDIKRQHSDEATSPDPRNDDEGEGI